MTEYSQRLLDVARALVAECPLELGAEVAVTGSVGAGLADEHSDIELLFLCEPVPDPSHVRRWLESISGAESILAGRDGSGTWAWCRLDGVELDPFWGELSEARAEVEEIAHARVVEHRRLAFAHVLQNAVMVRTGGVLPELARRCDSYPPELGRRLIEEALSEWAIPATRIGTALRDDVLCAFHWLEADAHRILRIIFALNEQWEPPRWKWLREYAATLVIAPPGLAGRVEAALVAGNPVDSSRVFAELGLETLDLLPDEIETGAARASLGVRMEALASAGAVR